MGDVITFSLVDASSAPKTDAVPTFSAYRDRSGNARTPPAIQHVVNGTYRFVASDDDVAEGVAWAIDSGVGAYPERHSGAIYAAERPFAVMLLTTSAGALWSGSAPTVGVYADDDGNARTPPIPQPVTAFLYALTPVRADLEVGVIGRLDAPASASPPFISFEFDALPSVVVPADTVTPPSSPAIAFSQSAYVGALAQLLPRGKAFDLAFYDGTGERRVLQAIADELARVDARGVDLIEESDPRTADETIGDWERMLSLPDDRVRTIPGTLGERRVAVTQKYTNRGGQNDAFFIGLAAACGFTVAGGSLPSPVISTVIGSGTGGILGAGTYTYRVTAMNFRGETLASAQVGTVVGAGTTNKVTVSWPAVPGADHYRVYGRTAGSQLYLDTVFSTSVPTVAYVDDGGHAPAGSMPVTNTATYPPIEKFAARMLRVLFRCSDRVFGLEYAFTMLVNVQLPPSGTALGADFERVIRHATHSHIKVVFVYH